MSKRLHLAVAVIACACLSRVVFGQSADRPVSGGVFTDGKGGAHPWYINSAHTLIWDGSPFVPAGIVFESQYLCEQPTDEAWLADAAVLDLLRSRGVADILLRPSAPMTLCPREAWRKIIAHLEEKGFTYGVEIADGVRGRLSFFIIRPAVYRDPGIKLPFQRAYTIPGVVSCPYCVVDPKTGGVVRHGYARVSDGQVQVNLADEAFDGCVLILYPEKQYTPSQDGYPDLWGGFGEYRDRLLKHLEGLPFGPGLRFFANPLGRTLNLGGEFATAIPNSSDFRTEFEAWLSQRYANPAAACTAWGMSPSSADSFQQLARLLPFWAQGRGVGSAYDRATDTRYGADTQTSQMWNDILEFRDSSIQAYMNTVAGLLKKYAANVPVVFYCSGQFRVFANGSAGGFDGLAADDLDSAARSYSLAEDSATTMWLLAIDRQAGARPSPDPTGALKSLGVKAFYASSVSARTEAENPQAIADAMGLRSDLALANIAEYVPNVLYYPLQPPVAAKTARLPDGSWWIPTLRQGAVADLGDDVPGYVLGSDLFLWTSSTPRRLTFGLRSPAERRISVIYPAPTARGSAVEFKKDRMTVAVSSTPVVVRGLDPLETVPFETARDALDRLSAYVEYAGRAGAEIAAYKQAIKGARKVLDAGRPFTALDMARANLQRLCTVICPYLWFEGESIVANSFDGVRPFAGASAGLCLAIDNPADPPVSPYSVTLTFDVPRDGKFDIWLAGSAPGRDGASPAAFSVDGTAWSDLPEAQSAESYAPGLYWQKLGTISLAGGRHTFALRLRGRGEKNNRFVLDALVFASAPFTPKGTAKPVPTAQYIPGGR